jgi:hypothetical protein
MGSRLKPNPNEPRFLVCIRKREHHETLWNPSKIDTLTQDRRIQTEMFDYNPQISQTLTQMKDAGTYLFGIWRMCHDHLWSLSWPAWTPRVAMVTEQPPPGSGHRLSRPVAAPPSSENKGRRSTDTVTSQQRLKNLPSPDLLAPTRSSTSTAVCDWGTHTHAADVACRAGVVTTAPHSPLSVAPFHRKQGRRENDGRVFNQGSLLFLTWLMWAIHHEQTALIVLYCSIGPSLRPSGHWPTWRSVTFGWTLPNTTCHGALKYFLARLSFGPEEKPVLSLFFSFQRHSVFSVLITV